MFEQYNNLTIRNATVEDADLLSEWWNNGEIMAHAGFPNGTVQQRNVLLKKYRRTMMIFAGD